MAGDWIKWMKGLVTKLEVQQISSILDLDAKHVCGGLMLVWEWCDSNISDACDDGRGNAVVTVGTLHPVTLDRISGVTGMSDALTKVGWFNAKDGTWTFPNFFRHNGQPAKSRALTADRVSKHRQKNVTLQALPEKRREEKRRQTAAAALPAAVSHGAFGEAIRKALRKAGIGQPTLDELAGQPGLTLEIVDEVVADCRSRRKGVGAIVLGIRDELHPDRLAARRQRQPAGWSRAEMVRVMRQQIGPDELPAVLEKVGTAMAAPCPPDWDQRPEWVRAVWSAWREGGQS